MATITANADTVVRYPFLADIALVHRNYRSGPTDIGWRCIKRQPAQHLNAVSITTTIKPDPLAAGVWLADQITADFTSDHETAYRRFSRLTRGWLGLLPGFRPGSATIRREAETLGNWIIDHARSHCSAILLLQEQGNELGIDLDVRLVPLLDDARSDLLAAPIRSWTPLEQIISSKSCAVES